MRLAIVLLLSSLSFAQGMGGKSGIGGKAGFGGGASSGGAAPVITLLASGITSPQTTTPGASIGDFVCIVQTRETAAFSTPGDNASNTYAEVTLFPSNNTGDAAEVDIWCSKITNALTSGSSTVHWGSAGNQIAAFKITGLTTGAVDQSAINNANNNVTTHTSGTTAALAGVNDMCVGAFIGVDTFSVGGGWTSLVNGLTNDSRQLLLEWEAFTTGTIQATATSTTGSSAAGIVCAQ